MIMSRNVRIMTGLMKCVLCGALMLEKEIFLNWFYHGNKLLFAKIFFRARNYIKKLEIPHPASLSFTKYLMIANASQKYIIYKKRKNFYLFM